MSSDIARGRASSGRLGSRYELHERIETATTSSSRVTSWRAYDTTLRRQVRLDVHRPGGPAAARFLDAAFAAGAVTHPALARVLDVVDEGDGQQAYVVSAWIEGTPLTALLAEGPLEPDQAVTIIGALTAGVTAAHQAGTTVGVLRPDHVLLTHSGAVTLVRVPRAGPTPVDDVRGLGALLYAALTARWPLDTGGMGLPPAPTTGGRLCTPRQLRAGIPADLSTLTMRALYPDHPGGIASAAAFADALAARNGPPPPDLLPFRSPDPVEPPPVRGTQRRGFGRFLAPVAGVLVIGLLAWLVVSVATGGGKHPAGRPAAAASNPRSSTASSAPHSSASKPKSTTQPLQPAKAASVVSYNPFGQPPGDDNADKVGMAYDGNPATAWETDPYMRSANFGNLKAGTGLIFDMGSPVTIRQIRISTPTPGISLQVLGADSPSQQPDAMQVIGSESQMAASAVVNSSSKTPHRYWVVWLTKLVPASGGEFQGGVSEVRFLR